MRRWGVAPYVWSERLAAFYEQTEAFLYETLVWNRTTMKQEIRRRAAAFLLASSPLPQRVLVFGDGLGIDTLFLAEAGLAVDYFEVSERCIRFARRLAESLRRELSIVSSPADVARESYDAVVCLDVLEHVPHPPQVVALLTSFLRPHGSLVVHAPFWYLHPCVATHLRSNLRYSGDLTTLYRANGLTLVGGELFWNPLMLAKPGEGTVSAGWRPRLKVTLGGCLLKCARICWWPHVLAYHWLLRKDRRRLRELAAEIRAV
jgi:SAM-dependent methyltransferase